MPMIRKINSEVFSDLARGLRLLVIIAPVSVAVVSALALAKPAATGDEIAAIAAVPLLISYLMIRAIMWLASGIPEATEEDRRILEQHRGQHPPQFSIQISGTLAIPFVLGMWWIVAGGLSAGV